jgi:hypothetical protein
VAAGVIWIASPSATPQGRNDEATLVIAWRLHASSLQGGPWADEAIQEGVVEPISRTPHLVIASTPGSPDPVRSRETCQSGAGCVRSFWSDQAVKTEVRSGALRARLRVWFRSVVMDKWWHGASQDPDQQHTSGRLTGSGRGQRREKRWLPEVSQQEATGHGSQVSGHGSQVSGLRSQVFIGLRLATCDKQCRSGHVSGA